jgi:hypothetical protein
MSGVGGGTAHVGSLSGVGGGTAHMGSLSGMGGATPPLHRLGSYNEPEWFGNLLPPTGVSFLK